MARVNEKDHQAVGQLENPACAVRYGARTKKTTLLCGWRVNDAPSTGCLARR